MRNTKLSLARMPTKDLKDTLNKDWEDKLNIMNKSIIKLTDILEGSSTEGFTKQEWISINEKIYCLCAQYSSDNNSKLLYEIYKRSFNEYIASKVLPAIKEKQEQGDFMLREIVKRWKNHILMVRWLSVLFNYLNRYYLPNSFLPSLKEVGLGTFHDLVYMDIKDNARAAVLSLIEEEREGHQIDQALLKNIVDIFVQMGMGSMDCYENDFEQKLLEDSKNYYSRKTQSWILEDSCPVYMSKVEACLIREKNRVFHYLHANSESKLLTEIANELLAKHEGELLENHTSGAPALFKMEKEEDLSRMFRLFSIVTNSLKSLANIFKEHVIMKGTELLTQVEDEVNNKVFVSKVIQLHDLCNHYVVGCFQNHNLFKKALHSAFVVFCNKEVVGDSTAELLANFADEVLKKGCSEKLSDDEIDNRLEKVTRLLVFIEDKDLFGEFYRKKLARRMMFDKSVHDSYEKIMLSKLKQECGSKFTSKMEGMVKDISLAKGNMNAFKVYLENYDGGKDLDMDVKLLTSGFWPTYNSSDIILPIELAKRVEVFQQYYYDGNKNRKLTWLFSLGTCSVTGYFDAKEIDLTVATYQAALLMLFNDSDKLNYVDIKLRLNLEDKDIYRLLHSLACAKYKILLKTPNTPQIEPTDSFEFNFKFDDRMKKIKVPLPPLEEKKKIIEDVTNERCHAIDASLVRIMKCRKVLAYPQLVSECVEQLRKMFKPDLKMIKKRVEDLISREYLERDPENPNVLNYVA